MHTHAYVCVCTECNVWRAKEGRGPHKARVTSCCELPNLSAENHSGLLEEQDKILTTESSLQPLDVSKALSILLKSTQTNVLLVFTLNSMI